MQKPSNSTTMPHAGQTGFVQVVRQLDRRLHLHVVLEEAAAERGLVVQVGLARLGLDGRLVPGLRHLRRHGPDAAHGGVVIRPVRHRVRLLAAEEGAKGPVRVRSVALASVLLLWHSAWLKACLAVAPSLFMVCTRFDIGLHV